MVEEGKKHKAAKVGGGKDMCGEGGRKVKCPTSHGMEEYSNTLGQAGRQVQMSAHSQCMHSLIKAQMSQSVVQGEYRHGKKGRGRGWGGWGAEGVPGEVGRGGRRAGVPAQACLGQARTIPAHAAMQVCVGERMRIMRERRVRRRDGEGENQLPAAAVSCCLRPACLSPKLPEVCCCTVAQSQTR